MQIVTQKIKISFHGTGIANQYNSLEYTTFDI
jgi:hypothetical protein